MIESEIGKEGRGREENEKRGDEKGEVKRGEEKGEREKRGDERGEVKQDEEKAERGKWGKRGMEGGRL